MSASSESLPLPLGRRLALWLSGLGRQPADGAAPVSADAQAKARRDRTRVKPRAGASSRRSRAAVDAQAEQVEALRQRAHTDRRSGLPNRRHFVGRLQGALDEPAGAALLILRLLRDEAAWHAGAAPSAAVATIAEALAAYPQRVPGAFAGRLNETDFGLCLPAVGSAAETAASLLRLLGALPSADGAVQVVVGGIDGLREDDVTSALAGADEALAHAEAAGPGCIEIRCATEAVEAPIGERAWRARLDQALAEGRAQLGEFAVRGRDGGLVHLECPLRIQLDAGGAFREARGWLAMALRARLVPRVDLAALDLALAAIARDGKPRCVHVGSASLASAGFVGEVARRLDAVPAAGPLLSVEVADAAGLARLLPRLREAVVAWRRHGVRVGVEHAGASMPGLARLAGLGLDHVKVEARFVRGAATEAEVRDFAAALVVLVHGMGLQAIAEGVDDAADLAALWELGFDAATGPGVAGD